jgi:S1-C subfamily serine protease
MRQRNTVVAGAVVAGVIILAVGAMVGGGIAYAASRRSAGFDAPEVIAGLRRVPVLAARADGDERGVVVADVADDSPAAGAGVVRGDILLELGGRPTDSRSDVLNVLNEFEPGDEVEATLLHGSEERNVSITLGDLNGDAFLGITLCGVCRLVPEAFAESGPAGLPEFGAVIVSVTPGSPAEKAGVQVYDVIATVDGEDVTLENGLADVIGAHEPGDSVTLGLLRPGAEREGQPETIELVVDLGQHPDDAARAYLGVEYRLGPRGVLRYGPGALGWMDKDDMLEHMERLSVVTVTEVVDGSPAAAAGLQKLDVVEAIDGTEVATVNGLLEAIAAHKPGDRVTLSVQSTGDDAPRDVEVTLSSHPDDDNRAYLGVRLAGVFDMRSRFGGGRGPMWHFELPGNRGSSLGGSQDL